MRPFTPTALTAVLVLALGATGCQQEQGGSVARDTGAAGLASAPAPVRVVAVGDIACPPGVPATATTCRQGATARLARSLDPDHVITLGDEQYERGTYYAFVHSYDRSWGSLKAITKPLPGNHEYKTPGAAGYYRYFNRSAPGYYAFNVGSWRIYNLNTNCGAINCTRELTWLEQDLAAHPHACTAIAMHHPRFSSGYEHGNNAFVKPFWQVAYRKRVDIALAGHDHDYERFARLSPAGRLDPGRGILSYVSGAGGKNLYRLGVRKLGSQFFHGRRFGVLALDLGQGGWSWKYTTIDGVVRDSGSRRCV